MLTNHPLETMKTGAEQSFEQLWLKAQPVVFSFIRSMIFDPHQAEDVLQEVSTICFQKYESFDPDRPFVPWAMGVSKNVILNHRRKYARNKVILNEEVLDAVADAHTEVAENNDDQADHLKLCMEKVEGRAKTMLEMRYIDNLKPKDIAQEMNLSSPAVRVALGRVRQSLKNCIEAKQKNS
ncbi:MAG: sigma-70 family RNA polymerase sigma factor [Planctomycetes bacterium]|nr:sigma-70 family RNA polymerase sigma factor [Planctomycetota bacterium]